MSALSNVRMTDPVWELVVCRRLAGPPIRFTGCLRHHVSTGLPGGQQIHISLWQRKKGDLAASFTWPTMDQWREDAFVSPDLAQAMDELEARCTVLQDSADSDPVSAFEVFLATHGRFARDRQRFLDLAGQALDHWMRIDEASAAGTSVAARKKGKSR